MPDAVKPPARPRRHEARRAAANSHVAAQRSYDSHAHEPLRQRQQLHTEK